MTSTEQTLRILARSDPDYPAFAADLPPDIFPGAAALPEGFADDVASLIREERPELSTWMDTAQSSDLPPQKLAFDPLAAAGVLSAIVFLLRSHIKIEGKHFSFEHTPLESEGLNKVLGILEKILGVK